MTPEVSANGNGNGNRSYSKADDEDVDEGGADGDANPLFEGNHQMAQKLHVVFPCIAIGVRTRHSLDLKH